MDKGNDGSAIARTATPIGSGLRCRSQKTVAPRSGLVVAILKSATRLFADRVRTHKAMVAHGLRDRVASHELRRAVAS